MQSVPNNNIITHLSDVCSVCNGDNTTCLGCDSGIWSDKIYDVCGVCGGDNSTCLTGCDMVPWSNKTNDICGVCGGDGSTCIELPIQRISSSKSNNTVIIGAIVFFVKRRNNKNNESPTELTTYSGMSTPALPKNYSQFGAASGNKNTGEKSVIYV